MFTRSHMAYPSTIMAFCARGREIGYVRLDHGQLVRYGVKTIKGARRGVSFTRNVERALSSVLQTVEPPSLIVLERFGTRATAGALCRTIIALSKPWKIRGYRVCFLVLDDVKHEVCGDDRVTHRELMEAIVKRYPILWSLITHSTDQKTKYWATVCLALALADAAQQRSAYQEF